MQLNDSEACIGRRGVEAESLEFPGTIAVYYSMYGFNEIWGKWLAPLGGPLEQTVSV